MMKWKKPMFSKISPILDKYLAAGDRVILGVSGGPDSTALLDFFIEYFSDRPGSKRSSLPLIVAHVNHGIRGRASGADEKFVRQMAKSRGLKCEVKRVKLAGKTHQEELGRKIRREFFEKLRQKHGAKWIVTAHTQDDQIETIVMNFLRGSGPAGLAGMQTANGPYLKPFLAISKAEILARLQSRKLAFRTDRTNEDARYRRNFIRKKILPLFEHVNPSFRAALLRNAEIFLAVDQWLAAEADKVIASSPFKAGGEAIPSRAFLRLSIALQQMVIQRVFQRVAGTPYRLPRERVGDVLRMVARGVGRKKIEVGRGVIFAFDKGLLSIYHLFP